MDKLLSILRGVPDYAQVVSEAIDLYGAGFETQARALLETVVSNEDILMRDLIEKLEGKPVANTLKKIAKGNTKSLYENIKGWLSLGVHAAIECEKGNSQYHILLNRVSQKINSLLGE